MAWGESKSFTKASILLTLPSDSCSPRALDWVIVFTVSFMTQLSSGNTIERRLQLDCIKEKHLSGHWHLFFLYVWLGADYKTSWFYFIVQRDVAHLHTVSTYLIYCLTLFILERTLKNLTDGPFFPLVYNAFSKPYENHPPQMLRNMLFYGNITCLIVYTAKTSTY